MLAKPRFRVEGVRQGRRNPSSWLLETIRYGGKKRSANMGRDTLVKGQFVQSKRVLELLTAHANTLNLG